MRWRRKPAKACTMRLCLWRVSKCPCQSINVVPVFSRALNNLSAIVGKACGACRGRKSIPRFSSMPGSRRTCFPSSRQYSRPDDSAKGCAARSPEWTSQVTPILRRLFRNSSPHRQDGRIPAERECGAVRRQRGSNHSAQAARREVTFFGKELSAETLHCPISLSCCHGLRHRRHNWRGHRQAGLPRQR